MTGPARPTPRVILTYGVLGIIPFWSLAVASVLAPNWVSVATMIEAVYAALILSFLGGARWGMAIREVSPNPMIVGLAMTPTL